MTIREGLYTSTNMIAIKLGWEEVGIETVAQTARRMGIQTEIERFPSTTIGAAEVIPIQMAEAYSAFPNLGTKVRPFPILRVEDAEGQRALGAPARAHPGAGQPRVPDHGVHASGRRHPGHGLQRGPGGRRACHARSPPRARPARPTTAPTSGSPDSRPTCWRSSGSAWTRRCRSSSWAGRRQATGGALAAPVWGDFMKHGLLRVAAGQHPRW